MRGAAKLERSRRQGLAGRVDRRTAHQPALELERRARPLAHRLEDADGLGDHFLTDTVTRENRDSVRCHQGPTSFMREADACAIRLSALR